VFDYTGKTDKYTQPKGYSKVTITVQGSNGGSTSDGKAFGGVGAIITGTYSLAEGSALYLNVGGMNGWSGNSTSQRVPGGGLGKPTHIVLL